jgi:hypothetical protein
VKTGETRAVLNLGANDEDTSLKTVSLNLSELAIKSELADTGTCSEFRLGQGMVRMGTRAKLGSESEQSSEDH